MRIRSLVVLIVAACTVTAHAADVPPDAKAPPKEKFHLFLLMGQSNMSASVKLDKKDLAVAGRILVLDPKDGKTWKGVLGEKNNKHFAFPVGPGFGFAAEMARKNPTITIGLIPVAVSGSPLSSWEKGAGHYKRTVERLANVRKQGALKGVLWHQGETDAYRNNRDPHSYGKRLAKMIGDLRAEIKAPKLPFVVGEIGHWVSRKRSFRFVPIINAALNGIPKAVANTACVSSAGLGHYGGNLHFNESSSHEFGRRYAAAYVKLVEKPKAEAAKKRAAE